MYLSDEEIAKMAYAVNRVWCQCIKDGCDIGAWYDVPLDVRNSTRAGVTKLRENPDLTPENMHENWVKYKKKEDWRYGPLKDFKEKTHPCLRPWDELPEEQRMKDVLFVTVVRALLEVEMPEKDDEE